MTNCCVARVLLTLPVVLVLACTGSSPEKPASVSVPKATPDPPVAEVRPFSVQSPNGARADEYYWLRDDTRTDTAVLGYLEAENAYTAAMTAHTQALEDRVCYQEIVGRIQQDDSTVPYRKRGYWYYTRYEAGREHPVFARKAGTLEAPEQVMVERERPCPGSRILRGWRVRHCAQRQAAGLCGRHGRSATVHPCGSRTSKPARP